MKQLIISIMLWLPITGYTCDNCNVYLNISPNDYKNSIGIYGRHRAMFGEYNLLGEMIATKHTGHGNDMAFWGKKVKENYFTYELRGSFYIREKWKTTVILPYINNTQWIGDFKRYDLSGIGDPIILESYQLLNTRRDTVNKDFTQRLSVGAGLKLPIGKTDLTYSEGTPNLDLQPGSGSWDALGFIAYAAKWRFLGLTSNLNLKRNGFDANDYRYGNVVNGTFNLFGEIELKRHSWRFSAGTYFEYAKMDESRPSPEELPIEHNDTGGSIIFGTAKVQFFTKHFQVFFEYLNPLKSNLNGYTQLLTKQKFNTGIIYTF